MKKGVLISCGIVALLGIGLLAGLVALLVGWALAVTRPVASTWTPGCGKGLATASADRSPALRPAEKARTAVRFGPDPP